MRIITLLLWLLLGGLYFYLWHTSEKTCCQPQDDDLSGLLYEDVSDFPMNQTLQSPELETGLFTACRKRVDNYEEENGRENL